MHRILSVILLLCASAAVAVAGDWTETVKLKGDLRYRHEAIDKDGSENRSRHRIRARLAVDAAVEENLSLHFRLASGSSDPVSTNQTLGGAGSTKGFGLDLAYFAWMHDSSLQVTGGKVKNPFVRPAKQELIFDGDLTPEGVAAGWKSSGDVALFVNGAGFWLDERSSAKNAAMLGGQAGLKGKTDGLKYTVGGSLYRFSELMGPLLDDDFFGNTSVADGADMVFGSEFSLMEVFAEVGFAAGDVPVTLFVDYVVNSDADADDTAYMFGLKLNSAKKPGDWAASWNYREVEADAVLGAWTDSDFIGGGTGGKGHEFGFAYQASAKSKVAVTYFVNEIGLENGTDYKRLQADYSVKF